MKSIFILSLTISGMFMGLPAFREPKKIIMQTTQIPNQNKVLVRKLYEEILNTGQLDRLNEIISEVYDGPRGIKGPLGFAETVKPVIAAFPDIQWTIEDILAESDEVMVRWSWKGTNKHSFDGFPVTNALVTHHAISIFLLSEHKIVKGWMQSDRLGFYQQIGVISGDAIKPPK